MFLSPGIDRQHRQCGQNAALPEATPSIGRVATVSAVLTVGPCFPDLAVREYECFKRPIVRMNSGKAHGQKNADRGYHYRVYLKGITMPRRLTNLVLESGRKSLASNSV
jgi:hypothetical protein